MEVNSIMPDEDKNLEPNQSQHRKDHGTTSQENSRPLREGDFSRRGSTDRPIRNEVEIEIDYTPIDSKPKED